MDKRKWDRIKDLFNEALTLEPDKREAFVQGQSVGDDELAERVLAMLKESTSLNDNSNEISRIVDVNAAQYLESEAKLTVGDTIEQFRIVSPIGEGGMGSVFLAERENSDFSQLVAIKVIHQRMLGQLNEQRFKLERQILASLKHPNIAGFIGGGQTNDGFPYIILEYVDGVNISDYCQQNKLTTDQVLDLFQQVLSAVTYSHQNLIVHRDIKSSNVLVTNEGRVKLLDFGIAKLLEGDKESAKYYLTQISTRVLTHSNAAPEQVLGEPVTTSTDVYGLGSLLMQLLTNTPVFDYTDSTQRELETKILEQTPVKPSQRCKESSDLTIQSRLSAVKGDLDTIVLKALNKSADKRYVSVEALAYDIQCYRSNYPIISRPPSRWYGFSKFVQRNKLSSSLAGVLVIGLVSFAIVVSYQSAQIQQQRDRAVQQALIAQETTRYLSDIFVSADPNVNDGEVISAATLIDEAYASALALDGAPAIKAELLIVLAGVYQQINEIDKAFELIQHVESQLAENSLSGSAQQRLRVMSLYQLGASQVVKGDYLSAINSHRKNLEIISSLRDEVNLDLNYYKIASHYSLAAAQTYTLKNAPSLHNFEQVIALSENTQYEEEYTARAYFGAGAVLRDMSRFEESKAYMLKGLAFNNKYDVKPTLDLAHGLNQFSNTLLQLNEYDEALEYAKKGLKIRQDIHKTPSIEVAASMGMVANILVTQQNYDKAIETREAMLEVVGQTVGKQHPFYPISLSVIGRIHLLAGNIKEAENILTEALSSFNEINPNGSADTIVMSLELSAALYFQNSYAEASKALETAIINAEKHLEDRDNYRFSIIKAYSALIAWREKKLSDEMLQEALTVSVDSFKQTYDIDTTQYRDFVNRIESMQ